MRNMLLRPVLMYTITPAQRQMCFRDIERWIADRGVASNANPGGAIFNIAGRYPLDRVVEAHKAVEAGAKIGHVLVDISQA